MTQSDGGQQQGWSPQPGESHQGGAQQPGQPPQQGPGGPAFGYPAGNDSGGNSRNQPEGNQPGDKKNTGLVVGVSVLGVLLIAGIVALIILLTGGNDKPAAAAPSTTAPSTTAPPPSTASEAPLPKQKVDSAQALSDKLIAAYNTHNQAQVDSFICESVTSKLPVSPTSTMTATGPAADSHLTGATAASTPVSITENGATRTNALSFFYAGSASSWCSTGLVGAAADAPGSQGSSQDIDQLKDLAHKVAAAGALGDGKTIQDLSCYSTLVTNVFNPIPGMAPAGDPTFDASERAQIPFTSSSGSVSFPAQKLEGKWCLYVKVEDKQLKKIA